MHKFSCRTLNLSDMGEVLREVLDQNRGKELLTAINVDRIRQAGLNKVQR